MLLVQEVRQEMLFFFFHKLVKGNGESPIISSFRSLDVLTASSSQIWGDKAGKSFELFTFLFNMQMFFFPFLYVLCMYLQYMHMYV